MTMHTVDWVILAALVVGVSVIGWRTQKYTVSVADFLAANRCAGKYILGISDGIAGLCAISIVALFEMYYKAGFTGVWWQSLLLPVGTIVAVSGWIQYRFRQTRAMTMAQFFELRYSRRFRVFAGVLAYISGIVNFGIFPAVAARFFQHYCGFPMWPVAAGPFEIDLVYAAIMAFLVGFALLFTVLGGQIVVMVTDFFQGVVVNVLFVVLGVYLLWLIDWSKLAEAIASAPANASLVNPVKTAETDNFNPTYFIIQVVGTFFTFMAWQGNQGYYGSAKTPHEAKMGRVVGSYRMLIQTLPLILIPVAAYMILHHADFAGQAQQIQERLNVVGSAQLQSQLTVSVALTTLLPVGLLGCFAAVMFAAFVTTHDTYLHAWGSILVQDVVLPIRNTLTKDSHPLTPEAHLRWLRISICLVAVFVYVFSLLFNQQQDIFMFFALTGTIFLGWAGAAIVGGLYTRWGTTAGAWTAAVFGMLLAVAGWYMTYFWGSCQGLVESVLPSFWSWSVSRWPELAGAKCPITAQVLWGYTMLASTAAYVLVSVFTRRSGGFDLDRLLHRGRFAKREDEQEMPPTGLKVFAMGPEYTFADRCLVIGSYAYVFVFTAVFLFGTFYALRHETSDDAWLRFWHIYCYVMLGFMTVLTVWFAIGGARDVRRLFQTLKTMTRDNRDDGTVIGHMNLDEVGKTAADGNSGAGGSME